MEIIKKMSFTKNVFINCPLDNEYIPLLKCLLFTIKKIGLNPRLALERHDSGEIRLQKIKQLIEESKYSIHDLSKVIAEKKGDFFRLNMPFELGLDLGCRDYHSEEKYRNKKFLIIEKEKYTTQKALSDLSFADCKYHKNEPEEMVYEVRTWFVETGLKKINSASSIWDEYNYFYTNLFQEKKSEGFTKKDIERISVPEFLDFISEKI